MATVCFTRTVDGEMTPYYPECPYAISKHLGICRCNHPLSPHYYCDTNHMGSPERVADKCMYGR